MAEQTPSDGAAQEDLAKQIEQLRSDVSEITGTLRELTKSQVTELRSRAEQRAAEMRARGRETVEDVADQARQMENQAEHYVRENPLQALAIAAGLGILVGYLSRR